MFLLLETLVVIMPSIGRSCTELPKFKCHMYVMKHKQNIHKFKYPMYVIKHKQNILFLNNLFGKTYITNCGSHLAFSFAKIIVGDLALFYC